MCMFLRRQYVCMCTELVAGPIDKLLVNVCFRVVQLEHSQVVQHPLRKYRLTSLVRVNVFYT